MCWRAAICVGPCRSSTRWSWRPSRPLSGERKSPRSAPCWAQTGRVRLQVPTWTPAGRRSRAPVPSLRATCRASSPASWAKVCGCRLAAFIPGFSLSEAYLISISSALHVSLHPAVGVAFRRGQYQLLPAAHRQVSHPWGANVAVHTACSLERHTARAHINVLHTMRSSFYPQLVFI